MTESLYKQMGVDSQKKDVHAALKDTQIQELFPGSFCKIVPDISQDPEYATEGSAGFDFRADLSEPIYLNPGEITMVPTGLYFELPSNLELQVRPRSGLAAKHGVTVLNTPGTVDSDYRGEVKVILINHGKNTFVIENGERIAQGVIANVVGKKLVSLTKTETLNDSERGEGGFGSTGRL